MGQEKLSYSPESFPTLKARNYWKSDGKCVHSLNQRSPWPIKTIPSIKLVKRGLDSSVLSLLKTESWVWRLRPAILVCSKLTQDRWLGVQPVTSVGYAVKHWRHNPKVQSMDFSCSHVEDMSSIPSTHFRQLIATCNSRSDTLFWPPCICTHMHSHVHIPTHRYAAHTHTHKHTGGNY